MIHTPSFAQPAFSTRLKAHLTLQGPKTAMEMVDDAEINGDVARDVGECIIQDVDANGGGFAGTGLGEAGVKWWPNVFIDYTLRCIA